MMSRNTGLAGRCVAIAGLVMAALISQGCSTAQNTLTLSSVDHRKDYTQTFDQAYAAINDNGDYDLVLLRDTNVDAALANGDGTLQPQTVSPRELVHIRVYWKARSGVKPDHPASTNASIRWYMVADRSGTPNDVLEYSGCGLVMLYDNGATSTFNVRGAFLQPTVCRGCMTDPIGPGSINGTIVATMDKQRVKALLDQMEVIEASNAAQAAQAAASPGEPSSITR